MQLVLKPDKLLTINQSLNQIPKKGEARVSLFFLHEIELLIENKTTAHLGDAHTEITKTIEQQKG